MDSIMLHAEGADYFKGRGSNCRASQRWAKELRGVPSEWKLIPVNGQKQPIAPQTGYPMKDWQHQSGYDVDGIGALNSVVKAVGVLHGPKSGGLMVVDFDGVDARRAFQETFKLGVIALPKTISWTSQREHRRQYGYRVPEEIWGELRGKSSIKALGNEKKDSADLELFWNLQSVIVGAHPESDGYVWVEGCSPMDVEWAEAPSWLLDPLRKLTKEKASTNTTKHESICGRDLKLAREILQKGLQPAQKFSNYETWLAVGMALHHTSEEAKQPDALLDDYIAWCQEMSNYDEDEIRREWQRWSEKAPVENPVAFPTLVHMAEEAGWDQDEWLNNPAPGGFLWRGREASKKAREKAKSHPLGEWVARMRDLDWYVDRSKTVELVTFKALMRKAAYERRPITSYKRRFLRYNNELGFFEPVTRHTMEKLMVELLDFPYTVDKNGNRNRKNVKAQTAKSCTELAALKLHEECMDLCHAVAFRNGTYLLNSEELVPHSPDNKLTWAVNAEYQKVDECPPIMRQFIGSSFGAEWEPVIKVVLRYLVDPSFKCSKIILILGASGSGKGTFERLIEKLFPPSVVSVITSGFGVINDPDKIRQFVSGKRLVTFPDLQGRQFGVGTLYALTDGGKLTGRTLHESDTDDAEPFTGRVVICSTQAPTMDDAGNGMTRRMLVLPTSRRAGQKPDLDLDEKLEAELGQIVSWALQTPRQEVKRLLAGEDINGLLGESATAAEVDMDPVRSFINGCLVAKPSEHIPREPDLFKAFQAFCAEQNHKPTSQRTFLARLGAALPHLRTTRRAVPGTGSTKKVPITFFGFDVAEGLVSGPTMIAGRSLNTDAYISDGLETLKFHQPVVPAVETVLALITPADKTSDPDSSGDVPDSLVIRPDNPWT